MVTNNLSEKYVGYVTGARKSTLHLTATVWHKFIGHKCLQQASSLAFNTLLCLVPLSAVALFLLKTFGIVEDDNSPLIVALRDNFLPRYAAAEIVSELSGFANRNLGGLGVGGFLLFLVVSTMLFMSVEQHFNDIWGARHRLPIVQAFQKYAVFYTLLSVGPLLIWLFFSTATNWVFAHVFPWVLVYCVFFLMYIAMPNTFVKWSAALLGTFVAGDAVPDRTIGVRTVLGIGLAELQRYLRRAGDACRIRYLDLCGVGGRLVRCGGLELGATFLSDAAPAGAVRIRARHLPHRFGCDSVVSDYSRTFL